MVCAGDPSDGFLGVSRSANGRRWRMRPADPEVTRAHQLGLGVPEPTARAMASRGVAAEFGESFLRPTLRSLFPDPSTFAGMDAAAGLLIDALVHDRRMIIFADYDVDGATSAAQLVRWFRHMGRETPIYVPDRLTEGYGPSPAVFRKLREQNYELVITVDCGATAEDALAEAGSLGLDVIVIDHHMMRQLPEGPAALVNPNRPDCRSGQGGLAAAGVTFVLLAALNREARRRGLFETRKEPNPLQWLDLVALGAICDVTSLTGFNRALAAQGLKVLSRWENPGLNALKAVAGIGENAPGVFEAGFLLGPRINAAGRIGRSDLGARLLSTDDPAEAAALAHQLNVLNDERKGVEAEILGEAIATLEHGANFDPAAPAIVVAGEGWHPGVIGIVASRLRERYGRPVVVIGLDRGANVGKGSGRSQPGVNLGHAIHLARENGLLLTGGGHAMAAGLTLRPDVIPEFREFLCAQVASQPPADDSSVLDIDALVSPAAAGAMLEAFQRLAPFGPGNPDITVAAPDVRVERAMIMRGGHLRCQLVGSAGERLGAVAWRCEGAPLGDLITRATGRIHVAGRLKADHWGGKSRVQLEIDDAAMASSSGG